MELSLQTKSIRHALVQSYLEKLGVGKKAIHRLMRQPAEFPGLWYFIHRWEGLVYVSKQMWNDVWLCRSMCTCFNLDLFPHCFCKDVEPDGKLVHQFSRSTSGRRWVTWLDSGVFSWAPSTASNFHLWFQGWQPFHVLVFLLEHYDSKAHSWCLCDCCCKHWAESPFGAA